MQYDLTYSYRATMLGTTPELSLETQFYIRLSFNDMHILLCSFPASEKLTYFMVCFSYTFTALLNA